MVKATRPALSIAGTVVRAGTRSDIEIPVARLATGPVVSIPVAVVHGSEPGPCIWLSAAIHGDELNGFEIIREVLKVLDPRQLHGTVLAVPIVNAFGMLQHDRYLPDRRDLNRSFPGSARGSLAGRLAHLFMEEVVARCSHGIDLHTGSNQRTNYPQVRCDLDQPDTRRMAEWFHAPLMVHARMRDGSLREAAARDGRHVLVYEGGEALRFSQEAIQVGLEGVLRVLDGLGMRKRRTPPAELPPPQEVRVMRWMRAGRSGMVRLKVAPGDMVEVDQLLATVADTFSKRESKLRAPYRGRVIGLSLNPLVNRGDAVVNLAAMPAAGSSGPTEPS